MRKLALLAVMPLLVGGVAMADYSFSIPDFQVEQPDGEYLHMETVPAGETFGWLNFVADWSVVEGIPWSNELDITIDAPSGGSYLWDPVGGQSSTDPYQFDAWFQFGPEMSDGDWSFTFHQSYTGIVQFENVNMTLSVDGPPPPEPPDAVEVGVPSDTLDSLLAGEVDWYSVTLDGTAELDINTFATPDLETPVTDTELGLYDIDGNLIANNDDAGSLYSQIISELDAGTYYIAVGAYNTTFGETGWDVSSASALEGDYVLTVVPEPASLALLALGLLATRRR